MTSMELMLLFEKLYEIDEILHKIMKEIDEKYVETLRTELNYRKSEKP